MYAIVDIETTGGHAGSNGITEIAIYVHDGEKIIDSFSTLINPGYPIPNYISAFTNITNDMVEDAPKFEEVASRVWEMLENNIFVAHNVNFDYSFVKHQLSNAGYELKTQKLCTVRLSRKVFPSLRSYSLGNLCAALGIDIQNRHRAAGDAEATVILFKRILAHEDGSLLSSFLKKGSKEYLLPPNLPRKQFDRLSSKPGVYYFHDEHGKIIYVGKAVNLKKRVTSHFTGNSTRKQRQDFLRTIHSISFTECATELMALILESLEIKKHWPEFNRAQKQIEFAFGIYDYEDRNGYVRIAIDKVRKNMKPLAVFKSLGEALNRLQEIVPDHELCPKLSSIISSKDPCRTFGAHYCKGACEQLELPSTYNHRVYEAIEELHSGESYLIVDKGLTREEKSYIVVENGKFYGMGYISLDNPIAGLEDIKSYIQPQKENFFIRELLRSETALRDAKMVRFEAGMVA